MLFSMFCISICIYSKLIPCSVNSFTLSKIVSFNCLGLFMRRDVFLICSLEPSEKVTSFHMISWFFALFIICAPTIAVAQVVITKLAKSSLTHFFVILFCVLLSLLYFFSLFSASEKQLICIFYKLIPIYSIFLPKLKKILKQSLFFSNYFRILRFLH